MEISIFLAKVIGSYFVIIGILVLTNQKNVITALSQIRGKANFLVLGFITTLIGLMMIISHNIWVNSYQIAISIISWMVFVKGLLILFFPSKFFDDFVESVNKPIFYNLFGVVAILIGFWLTYFGFIT